MLLTILITVAVTVAVFVLVSNVSTGERKITHEIEHLYGAEQPQFLRAMGQLLGPAIVSGNKVTGLQNGDQIFPALLEAIRGARRTICFETFIYWTGAVGKELGQALIERSRAGVKVHVLLDFVGAAKLDKALIEEMQAAGVQVEKYHPLRWWNLGRLNNRTHRKILVVDGRIAFTGGVGIADQWMGHAEDEKHWRDSHYRVEGPVVAQLQAAFLDNWMKTRELVLHGDDYFPPLEPVGEHPAQVFKSSSGEGSESARLMVLLSITAATRSVRIGNAYFIPDDLAVDTLIEASKRGVAVEVILPGKHTDTAVGRKASQARWGKLLEAGIAIFEYQPTMYHRKVLIIDEVWTSVGSTNFDNRSFRLNDEANMNIVDRDFALGEVEIFEADKARSRRITLAEWQARPWSQKLREKLAVIFRSQL
jgi:cardiolipin synthase